MKRTTIKKEYSLGLYVLRSLAGLLLVLAFIPDHGGERILSDRQAGASLQELGFRHAGHNSIPDNWLVAKYLSDLGPDSSPSEESSTQRENISSETIYQPLNPTVNPAGLAGYLEIKGGDEMVSRQNKPLPPNEIGKWIAVWNGKIESVEDGPAGTSNEYPHSVRLGSELKQEIECAEWRDTAKPRLYLGPNASYRSTRWYVTITPGVELTHNSRGPDFSTRIILGIAL